MLVSQFLLALCKKVVNVIDSDLPKHEILRDYVGQSKELARVVIDRHQRPILWPQTVTNVTLLLLPFVVFSSEMSPLITFLLSDVIHAYVFSNRYILILDSGESYFSSRWSLSSRNSLKQNGYAVSSEVFYFRCSCTVTKTVVRHTEA